MDIHQTPDEVILQIELPGVHDKQNIMVDVDDGLLLVSGVREPHSHSKYRNGDFTRSINTKTERHYGKFLRSVTLPEGITAEMIWANYEDGILEITYPQTPSALPAAARRFQTLSKKQVIVH